MKLLRFLQEREYRPLGSSKMRSADVRLIAASNSNLDGAMRQGRLRQDFYFRINVLPLILPPLRERRQDVPVLARHFPRKFAANLHRPVPILSPEAERAVVLAERRGVISGPEIMLPDTSGTEPDSFQQAKTRVVAELERSYIESLLLAHHGNISHAAQAAGKNRRAFWELIRKHRIDANHFRGAEPEASDTVKYPGWD